jgi:preprotein translocase subunit SecG
VVSVMMGIVVLKMALVLVVMVAVVVTVVVMMATGHHDHGRSRPHGRSDRQEGQHHQVTPTRPTPRLARFSNCLAP